MDWQNFIVVGENIHCTRIVKRNGTRATTLDNGREAVTFSFQGAERLLLVPDTWGQVSPAFDQGNIKHAALGLYQAINGTGDDKKAGEDYLCWMAERQIKAGATFLDVNVDEYCNDSAEAARVMAFLVAFLSERYDTPLSIDSSNPEVLRAGLAGCRCDPRPPMVNSVSLEREITAELVAEFGAEVIVNAAGREGMPVDAAERLTNLEMIIAVLAELGVAEERMHIDPLVLPISTDPMNGSVFLEATAAAHQRFPSAHLNGGLSNISFGMPNRKLLNMVFMRLCAEAGTDGGIIDPVGMPPEAVAKMDAGSTPFKLAEAVLKGDDMFGIEYIAASRDGRL